MGWFRDPERGEVNEQQKWDYITLSDFRGNSCGKVFSYIWLWILVFITIGVYVADTFTAVKLLAFDQWSSQIKPTIPFVVAKWIFSGCIMLSWTLAILDWIIAIRTIKRGCVTDDYLNSTAVTVQSIRPGGGWKRFLVFAALTKSKKKVSWIAIFVYFQRQGCIRLLAAEGPRQVVNALTIYSVAKADLFQGGKSSGFSQFFNNLKALGQQHETEVLILSSMCFTLIIWVVSMVLLILALVLYVIFLWHYIQNETLAGFCRRKVETRLARIVKAKSDKELARQQKKWEKAERKAERTGRAVSPTGSLASTLPPAFNRKPTLPMLGGQTLKENELSRADSTMSASTLPPYTSQATTPADREPPAFHRQPTLPDMMNGRPVPPSRSATGFSATSYSSDAPLLSQAEEMGYSDPSRPYPMNRSLTGSTQRSFTSSSMQGGRPPLPPLSTQGGPRYPPPSRTNTGFSSQGRASPMSSTTTPFSAQSNRPLLSGNSPMTPWDARTQSPATTDMAYEMTPVEGRNYDFDNATPGIAESQGNDYFSMGQQPRAPTAPPMQSMQRVPTSQSGMQGFSRAATASPQNFSRPPFSSSPVPTLSRAPTAPPMNVQRSMTTSPLRESGSQYETDSYYENASEYGRTSPDEPPPADSSLPASLQIARRDVSAPGAMPPRRPPPSGALPWPPTQRSATAPAPDHYRGQQGPMQRSGSAAPGGW